jgi:hypothetical protein
MGACKSVALFGHMSNLHTEKRQSCNEISSPQSRESSNFAAEIYEGSLKFRSCPTIESHKVVLHSLDKLDFERISASQGRFSKTATTVI